MKKTLALILAVLMCVSTLALVACGGDDKVTTEPNTPGISQQESKPVVKPSNKPHKPTPDNKPTDDDGKTPNDILHPLGMVDKYPKVEHEVKEDLPSSATLVGTDFLPPIENQGSVGSCSSEAIAYLQFTNAVIRYEHSINPNSKWTAKDFNDCFSPKFTYQYGGMNPNGVYNVLRDHGCLKNGIDIFSKLYGASYLKEPNGSYSKKSVQWLTEQGIGETAMEYRFLRYEQIVVTDKKGPYYDSEKGVQLTTSEKGQELLQKIKDAVACGNVVVTGGLAGTWNIEKVRSKTGSLARPGDSVITYAKKEGEGAHQVCIVGYDDDFTIKSHGAEMKGAFIIANSWGTSWMKAAGQGGYVWCMYDAVNTVSEYEDFKLSASEEKAGRDYALDQFFFTYWDRDIVKGMPDLYAEIEVESTDRDSFKIELNRIDKNGNDVSMTPYIFYYLGSRPDNDLTNGYFNINGEVNGGKATGFHTVSFQRLLNTLPKGATYEDYRWGIKIASIDEKHPIAVKSITIKNSKKEVVAEIKLHTPDVLSKATHNYTFDLSKDSNLQMHLPNGKYMFKNVKTDKYLAKNRPMDFKVDSLKNALKLNVNYNIEKNRFFVTREDKKYVIDVKETLTTGAPLVFNAEKGDRIDTQFWNFSYNEDGTYTIYITSKKGTNYALGVADDGTVCIFKATELNDNIKWVLESDETYMSATKVKTTATGIEIDGTVANKSYKGVNIEAMNVETGEVVKASATVKDMKFQATMQLSKGTYVVKFFRDTNPDTCVTSFVVVTVG